MADSRSCHRNIPAGIKRESTRVSGLIRPESAPVLGSNPSSAPFNGAGTPCQSPPSNGTMRPGRVFRKNLLTLFVLSASSDEPCGDPPDETKEPCLVSRTRDVVSGHHPSSPSSLQPISRTASMITRSSPTPDGAAFPSGHSRSH